MKKVCVYTCITGDYDNLKEIKNKEKNIDYYCFTNNKNIKSKTWKVEYIEDKNLSNILLARKTKILGTEYINNNYDILLWMDAAVEFKKPINDFINEYLKEEDSFVCFKHGLRNKISEEMDACLRFRKETIDKIEKLKKFYTKEKYPDNNGLIESTVYIKRPKDKKVIETMNLWFDMVNNYTKRDQLSFNYCIFKTDLKVKWINEYVFNNDWFKWHEHAANKIKEEYMIYYKNINEYDYKYQQVGNFKVENNEYIIDDTIKFDTNKIYLEISNIPLIKYKIESDYEIDYQNTIDYDNNKIFYKLPGFVFIKGNFKKGDKLYLKIKYEFLEDFEKNELVSYLCDNKSTKKLEYEVSNIQAAYNELKESYDSILNSTSWKITKPIRSVISKIRK